MLDVVSAIAEAAELKVQARIGIHSGPITAGVIGTHKFVYDVWGDTVNTASRMESHSLPGRIQISAATQAALGDVGVLAALLVALVVVVAKLPDTNPLKRVLTALCYRLGATLAAGAIAIPLEPIPGIDLAYDVAVPIALIWYWFTFFRDARRTVSHTPSQKAVTYRQSK